MIHGREQIQKFYGILRTFACLLGRTCIDLAEDISELFVLKVYVAHALLKFLLSLTDQDQPICSIHPHSQGLCFELDRSTFTQRV